MLGWDATFYRNGQVIRMANGCLTVEGEKVHYIPPTLGFNIHPIANAAFEEVSGSGYPTIYKAYARDLPYDLKVPGDEVIIIKMWDQS